MAETRTPRLSLPHWSSGSDSPSRDDFNEAFTNLDNWAARDEQGTMAARPTAGVRGRYFWDTTNAILWRDTGTAWVVAGARVRDGLSVASAASQVALQVQGAASQTADIFQVKDSGNAVLASFGADGSFKSSFVNIANSAAVAIAAIGSAAVTVVNPSTSRPGLVVQGLASQVAHAVQVRDSSSSVRASVTAAGEASFNKVTVATATPTASNELVPKGWADSTYLKASGGVASSFTLDDGYLNIDTTGTEFQIRMSREGLRDTIPVNIHPTGAVQIGGDLGAQANATPLTVKGAPSQTANLFQVRDSTNVEVLTVSSTGELRASNIRKGTTAERTAALGSTPQGGFWWDTDTNSYYVRGSSGWEQVTTAASGTTFDAAAIVSGILPVARGGTGGGTPEAARTALGASAEGHTHTWASVTGKPSSFTPSAHTHDDRYYQKSEMDTALAGKAGVTHTHTGADITGNLNAHTVQGRQFIVSSAAPTGVPAGTIWFKV